MKPLFLLTFLTTFCSLFFGCSSTQFHDKTPRYTVWDKDTTQQEAGLSSSDDTELAPNADSTKREMLIYGKLLSLEKKDGRSFSFEPSWSDIVLSGEYSRISRKLEKTDLIPENEKLVMLQQLHKDNPRPLYVEAQIQVIQVFDDSTKQWIKAPIDSIYLRYYYVEHQGLFVSEERQSLVHLGKVNVPNSSARVFRLKPYAFLDDDLIIDSYSEPISEFEFANNDPNSLQYTPYQEKRTIKPPFDTPIRSNVIRSLSEDNNDSLRVYLSMAKELEDFYGVMPFTDEEYIRIAALDINANADSTIWYKMQKMWHHDEREPLIKDSLQALIIQKLRPIIFTSAYYEDLRKYSDGPYLFNFVQRPFTQTSKIIPDNRVSLRTFIGPTMRFYNDEMQQFIDSKSIGGTVECDLCYLYGCFGFGISLYATSNSTSFIENDGSEHRRASTNLDGSVPFHLGIRPIFNEILELEIYGLLNMTTYSLDEKNDKGEDVYVGSCDWGIGAAVSSNLFTIKDYPIQHGIMTIDYRLKVEHFWNNKPKGMIGPQGHTTAVSLQLSIGTTSYRFEEEPKDQPSRTIKEELARFWRFPSAKK